MSKSRWLQSRLGINAVSFLISAAFLRRLTLARHGASQASDGWRGLVSVEPGRNQEVVAALRPVEGVKQAHACWGQPDIFAFVKVEADRVLVDTVLTTIQGLPGIRTTETRVVAPV